MKLSGFRNPARKKDGNNLMVSNFNLSRTGLIAFLSLVLWATTPVMVFALEIGAVGRAVPVNHIDIEAQVARKITMTGADLGDQVKEGQILVQLDSHIFDLDVSTADAELDIAKARSREAQQDYERSVSLQSRNVSSGKSKDHAKAVASTMAAEVRAKQAALDLAVFRLEKAAIKAPFSGRISRRLVGVGSFIREGEPVFVLSDLSRIIVKFDLIERDVAAVKAGDKATIIFDALPDLSFVGQIARVGLVANKGIDTFPVEIEIENNDGLIRGGYTASITLIVGE